MLLDARYFIMHRVTPLDSDEFTADIFSAKFRNGRNSSLKSLDSTCKNVPIPILSDRTVPTSIDAPGATFHAFITITCPHEFVQPVGSKGMRRWQAGSNAPAQIWSLD